MKRCIADGTERERREEETAEGKKAEAEEVEEVSMLDDEPGVEDPGEIKAVADKGDAEEAADDGVDDVDVDVAVVEGSEDRLADAL